MKNVTNSFSLFMTETPETGSAYMDMVMKQSKASALVTLVGALETALNAHDEN